VCGSKRKMEKKITKCWRVYLGRHNSGEYMIRWRENMRKTVKGILGVGWPNEPRSRDKTAAGREGVVEGYVQPATAGVSDARGL
jgi:hypothetical protein